MLGSTHAQSPTGTKAYVSSAVLTKSMLTTNLMVLEMQALPTISIGHKSARIKGQYTISLSQTLQRLRSNIQSALLILAAIVKDCRAPARTSSPHTAARGEPWIEGRCGTPTFRLTGICKRHILPKGSSKIEKSETILKAAVMMRNSFSLMQCPGVDGSQILRLGMQARVERRQKRI